MGSWEYFLIFKQVFCERFEKKTNGSFSAPVTVMNGTQATITVAQEFIYPPTINLLPLGCPVGTVLWWWSRGGITIQSATLPIRLHQMMSTKAQGSWGCFGYPNCPKV